MALNSALKGKLALTTAALALFTGYGRRSYAGSCTPLIGPAIICSGAANAGTDAQQTLTATGAGSVVTATGFGINTSGATAIAVTGSGTAINFQDTNASTITGATNGLQVTNNGTGSTTITTSGTVTGTSGIGINTYNGTRSTDLTLTASGQVSGGTAGIYVLNKGTGATAVTTTDEVKGGLFGIFANNSIANGGKGGTSLTITASGDVTGNTRGIVAYSDGTGSTTITTTGDVTATTGTAIGAKVTRGGAGTSLTIDTSGTVFGGYNGIQAYNSGSGATTITATGPVTGNANTGIAANNSGRTTGLTINAVDVTGARFGIGATSSGSGPLTVNATGTVTATGATGTGIFVGTTGYGTVGDVTVTASGTVTGGKYGVVANNGAGRSTKVTTTGTVTGTTGFGIGVVTGGRATDIIVDASAGVTGGVAGINIGNGGSGSTTVIAKDAVTGTSQAGISVANFTGATDILIDASGPVTGGQVGILANNFGRGTTTVVTTGTVEGTEQDGIYVANVLNATDIVVETLGDVKGGRDGISAWNAAKGDTTITTGAKVTGTDAGIRVVNEATGGATTKVNVESGSLVEGGSSAVDLSANDGQTSALNNAGTLRNTSGLSSALAITSKGTSTTVENTGLVTGTVVLSDLGNSFNNASGAVWNTANGANDFGAGTDKLDNNGGTVIAAASSGLAETTSFDGLETFTNGGLVTMRDGGATDVTRTSGDYVGNGGVMAMDTYLGTDGSPTDLWVINGDASGSTTLAIANAGGPGALTTNDGIKVVQVDGTSTSDAFHLASTLTAGAYDYNLFYGGVTDPNDQDWYLRSVGLSGSTQTALPYTDTLVNFAEATLGTLQQRTGNRIWPNGAPAETIWCKDAAQNYRCTPTGEQNASYANGGPVIYGQGAWGRVGGQYSSFDPKSGTPYTQSIGFLQAGYEGVAYESGAGELTVGAFATVGTSRADIDVSKDPVTGAARSGKITSTGYGLGANLTWLGNDGLYADTIGQFTWYDSDLSNKAGGNNSGWSSLLSLEVGKRFDLGSGWSVVPQAQLAWTHADFDSFTDINGSPVSTGDGDSLKGRLGLRVENLTSWKNAQGKTDRLQLYGIANLSYQFLNGTSVEVAGASFTQQNKRLWGEVGLGGNYAWNDEWSLYGEADYAAALSSGSGDNYSVRGTAGLRYRW